MRSAAARTTEAIDEEMEAGLQPKAARDAEQRLKKAQRAAILLKQASDPTRLQVLQTQAEGERHVGALCELLNQTQSAVSHHRSLLRHGGLIAAHRQGKNNFYALTSTGAELAKVVKGMSG